MSNPYEHLANTIFLVNMLRSLKEGGVYVWIDTGFQYKRKGKKLLCNLKAFTCMLTITGGRTTSILQIDEQMQNL
jgi:hypothetical protein